MPLSLCSKRSIALSAAAAVADVVVVPAAAVVAALASWKKRPLFRRTNYITVVAYYARVRTHVGTVGHVFILPCKQFKLTTTLARVDVLISLLSHHA